MCDKQKKATKEGSLGQAAEVVAFRSLPDESDHERSPATKLKGLPKKKALHDRHKSPGEKKLYEDVPVPDLDSEEKGAVQFLGFKMLDT